MKIADPSSPLKEKETVKMWESSDDSSIQILGLRANSDSAGSDSYGYGGHEPVFILSSSDDESPNNLDTI